MDACRRFLRIGREEGRVDTANCGGEQEVGLAAHRIVAAIPSEEFRIAEGGSCEAVARFFWLHAYGAAKRVAREGHHGGGFLSFDNLHDKIGGLPCHFVFRIQQSVGREAQTHARFSQEGVFRNGNAFFKTVGGVQGNGGFKDAVAVPVEIRRETFAVVQALV